MKLQIVGYTLGVLITIVGLAEMVPAMVDWKYGHENAKTFFLNGIICLLFGERLDCGFGVLRIAALWR